MLELHGQDPRYGFDRHKGYATQRPPRRRLAVRLFRRRTADRSGRPRCLIGSRRSLGHRRAKKPSRRRRSCSGTGKLESRDRGIREDDRGAAARLEHAQHARRPLRPRQRSPTRRSRSTRRSPTTCCTEGFFPKAAALYKKILKIKPDEESVQLHLGEISREAGTAGRRQGPLPRRRQPAPRARRQGRRRRDHRPPRLARSLRLRRAHPGGADAGAERRHDRRRDAVPRRCTRDLLEKGRHRGGDRRAARGGPPQPGRYRRARRARRRRRRGGGPRGREAVSRSRAWPASDPGAADRADGDRAALRRPRRRARDPGAAAAARRRRCARRSSISPGRWRRRRPKVRSSASTPPWTPSSPAGNYMDAAAILQEFVTRVSGQIDALLKLVEICVDGGLEATMYETQAQLADAYLERGQGAEARVIAEDLVAREPWEHAHIDRFRRALRDARRAGSRRADRRSAERAGAVRRDRPVHGARVVRTVPERGRSSRGRTDLVGATERCAGRAGGRARRTAGAGAVGAEPRRPSRRRRANATAAAAGGPEPDIPLRPQRRGAARVRGGAAPDVDSADVARRTAGARPDRRAGAPPPSDAEPRRGLQRLPVGGVEADRRERSGRAAGAGEDLPRDGDDRRGDRRAARRGARARRTASRRRRCSAGCT